MVIRGRTAMESIINEVILSGVLRDELEWAHWVERKTLQIWMRGECL